MLCYFPVKGPAVRHVLVNFFPVWDVFGLQQHKQVVPRNTSWQLLNHKKVGMQCIKKTSDTEAPMKGFKLQSSASQDVSRFKQNETELLFRTATGQFSNLQRIRNGSS